jgi:hypothetical protein
MQIIFSQRHKGRKERQNTKGIVVLIQDVQTFLGALCVFARKKVLNLLLNIP